MAGPDPRSPVSIEEPGVGLPQASRRETSGKRASPGAATSAGCRSIHGLPQLLNAQSKIFEDLGCIVEEAEPDFSGATEAFETLRAVGFLHRYGEF